MLHAARQLPSWLTFNVRRSNVHSSQLFTQWNYWTASSLSLTEIAGRLESSFGLKDYEVREEDTDCWIEGWLPERVSVYVCRDRLRTMPARFIFIPRPDDVSDFGQRLADCLCESVSHGEVSYLGEEKFTFKEASRFKPKNA